MTTVSVKSFHLGLKVLVIIFLFAAMSPEPVFPTGGQQPSAGTGSDKIVELKIWSNERHALAFRQAGFDKFADLNPGIKINYEVFTEDYFNTLELSFQSGQSPDIFNCRANPAPYYVERNMLIPLDSYITPQFRARFAEPFSIENINTVDGKQYSLPAEGVSFRIIYNKEIFQAAGIAAPPKTLDEYYSIVKKITDWGKSNGIYGTAQQFKVPTSVGERVFDQFAYRNEFSSYNFRTGRYDFSVMKPILGLFRRMYAEGLMFPGTEGMEIDMVRAQFAEGKIGMYCNGSWEVGIFASNGQFPAKQDWSAAPYPGINTPNPKGKTKIMSAGNSWGISTSCKNPGSAWKLFEYMFTEDYLAAFQEGGYGFVTMPGAVAKVTPPIGMKGFMEFSTDSSLEKIWPVPPDMLNMVVEGRRAHEIYVAIVLGVADIDAGLEDLTTRYNTALDRGVANGTVKRIIDANFDPAK
jgi:multiple sugar transport system substrate-binding protein